MNSVILNRRSLENKLSITAKIIPSTIALPSNAGMARSTEPRLPDGSQAPGRDEHVDQDRVEDQLLHRRSPLQEGERGAGVLEGAGLVDHPELEGPRMGLDRDSAGVDQHDQEEGDRREDVAGRTISDDDERTVAARA